MKKLFYFLFAASALVACVANEPVSPDVNPEETYNTEYIEFCANVLEAEDGTRVSFDYTTLDQQEGFYTRWEGNEEMDVYIHSGSTYSFAGRIPVKEGSISDDRFSVRFAGDVIARTDPSTQSYIMVYTNSGARYDWTKQTIDFSEQAAGADGTKALKSYSPMVFEMDSQGNISMTNKACYIRFKASGLAAGAKVKSLAISSANAVFPKTFDLSRFDYQSDNKSKVLSYAFDNLVATDGSIDIFLAAPLMGNGEKDYEIHIVTEGDGNITTLKSSKGITSASALSVSKLYNLSRADFTGATNPATVVGQTQGGQNGASDVVIESIVGQWDKTGFLSNDIYGVLDMGKPENLTMSHNAAINAIDQIYIKYYSGNTDQKIHAAAVKAAGKAGCSEEVNGLSMTQDGPQYVTSIEDTGTFNNIVLTKDTEVYMTFIDSKAWNTNTIGYYCYSEETDPEGVAYSSAQGHKHVHDLIVFPSTSQSTKGEHLLHKFESRTTAQLLYPQSTGSFIKKFPAGTTIGLMERVNALVESEDFALKPISNSSPVHYTNIAWNKLNTLGFQSYWNQIAVVKFKMPDDSDFNRHGLIFAMKDQYAAHTYNAAANWTNPIILIYTSEPDAIDFARSADYWKEIVTIDSADAFTVKKDFQGVVLGQGQSLPASFPASGSLEFDLKVANPEFGPFDRILVTSGGVDITSRVVSYAQDHKSAHVSISKDQVGGEIVIHAVAARQIKAKSITAAELLSLAQEIKDNPSPEFRLILYSSTASSNNRVFGFDKDGRSVLKSVESPLFRSNSILITDPQGQTVLIDDQYNDFEWTLEYADGGFKLKKLDFDLGLVGYIHRSAARTSGYPLVKLTDAEYELGGNIMAPGAVFTAEALSDNGGYAMKFRLVSSGEPGSANVSSYNYMTGAIGYSLTDAIFNSNGNHVNQYGKWLVYKVWLE